MYKIAIDTMSSRINVVLSGTMTVDEVVAYMRDLRHAMAKAGGSHGYGLVIDVGGCTIQTQDMTQTMGRQMATMPKARAIAIVSVSALARMQIRRLFQQPYARVVSTVDEGCAWVTDGIEPPIDPPAPAPAPTAGTAR